MKGIIVKLIALLTVLGILSSCGFAMNKNPHGDELQKLSDNELYEAVYFQNLDVVDSYESEETALEEMSKVRRTVYILNMYEFEVANGGLCQFFANSSRSLAPYVSDCLAEIGATDHKQLYDSFVSDNEIDVFHLESFVSEDVDSFIKQYERYDFDSFDNSYMELPLLQNYITAYIRANITEF